MSISIPINSTSVGAFQTQFGTLPGTQDPKAECEKWQQLCTTLLAERQRLRDELDKVRLEAIMAEWDKQPIGTMDEVYATVVKDQTLEELIAELKKESETQDE